MWLVISTVLSNLKDFSQPQAVMYTVNVVVSCAGVDKVSTDIVCCAVLL